ncbi:hypothetical protein T4A_6304 [Trichinella pseudospiralis]|uniref:Uncharacterized protein n=1 Tax=Trichinella pseudospiralis TaxID=6337 RepID=A0A0V1DRW9_TRIPS|nr:hypothetical protein T4A_6304 [Trichinella pseudospiralis]KRY80190.1 hypothetical protein T4D_2180 [Trichinella pseudospiralis]
MEEVQINVLKSAFQPAMEYEQADDDFIIEEYYFQ